MKCGEFLRLLKRAGAQIDKKRGKGGHYLVRLNGRATTVPVHGNADYDPRFLTTFASSSTRDWRIYDESVLSRQY